MMEKVIWIMLPANKQDGSCRASFTGWENDCNSIFL